MGMISLMELPVFSILQGGHARSEQKKDSFRDFTPIVSLNLRRSSAAPFTNRADLQQSESGETPAPIAYRKAKRTESSPFSFVPQRPHVAITSSHRHASSVLVIRRATPVTGTTYARRFDKAGFTQRNSNIGMYLSHDPMFCVDEFMCVAGKTSTDPKNCYRTLRADVPHPLQDDDELGRTQQLGFCFLFKLMGPSPFTILTSLLNPTRNDPKSVRTTRPRTTRPSLPLLQLNVTEFITTAASLLGYTEIESITLPDELLLQTKKTYSAFQPHVYSPIMAEVLSILSALKDAKELGISSIYLQSNAQDLLRAISSQENIKEISGLLTDIYTLALSFSSVTFQFLSRSNNGEADELAKIGLRNPCSPALAH